jgi:hypothetical protein
MGQAVKDALPFYREALAFLGLVKQKPFFLQWIPRALSQLVSLLGAHPEWPCPTLREQVEAALELPKRDRRGQKKIR